MHVDLSVLPAGEITWTGPIPEQWMIIRDGRKLEPGEIATLPLTDALIFAEIASNEARMTIGGTDGV